MDDGEGAGGGGGGRGGLWVSESDADGSGGGAHRQGAGIARSLGRILLHGGESYLSFPSSPQCYPAATLPKLCAAATA